MAASKSWRSIDLVRHLEEFLSARGALDGRIYVALSGGRDSVVLLHAASRLAPGVRLGAIHVHHGLSPNADAWATHCARICEDLDVALQIEHVTVERVGAGLEAAARQARYEAFGRCPAKRLLLAHHQGDQAETVLFNLVRGAGTAGAAGIPPVRSLGSQQILRPFLGIAPEAIAAYADRLGLEWIEDESNGDCDFSRNYLRREIVPRLEARFPAATQCLGAAAERFAEAEALLADLATLDWLACADGECLRLAPARELSPARQKNLLRWRLRQLGWRVPVAARMDEFVRQLADAGPDRHPQLVLPDGEMHVRRGRLYWSPAEGRAK